MAGLPDQPLRQSWAYGVATQRMGAVIGRAVLRRRGGAEIAMAQVLRRGGVRLITQGPVWLAELDQGEKRRVLGRLAHHPGLTIATPAEPLSGPGLIPLITGRSRALWQIDHPVVEVRRELQGKWRNRLIKAEAHVQGRPLRAAALAHLIAQEAAQRRARGYQNLPGALALQWPGPRLALGWYSAGGLQAGMVFLIHGAAASYFLGWSSPAARAAFSHGPLLWQAMQRLRDQGVATVDLGDVNTEDGTSLARFKLGTGAQVQTMGATALVLPLGFGLGLRRKGAVAWGASSPRAPPLPWTR